MFKETDFIFDNIEGSQKGLAVVTVDGSGFMEQPFGITQNPMEEKIKGIDESFFYGVEREAKSFPITFAILDPSIEWDNEKRLDIVNWLFQSDYKPFISKDYPDIQYFIMAVSDAKIVTNSMNQGYITIQVKMATPYAYTIKQIEEYAIDQTDNIIELENRSNIRDYKYYPIFEFTLTGSATDITFRNLSDGGRELTFTGLNTGETIYINNKTGEIISSTNQPRLSECNRKWFRIVDGINRVQVITNNNGGCNLKAEMMFPVNF